ARNEQVPAAISELMRSAAVPEIAFDEPVSIATSEPVLSVVGVKAVAELTAPSTPLRDAIANARIIDEPAPWRTQLESPGPARGALGWISQHVAFDTTRPKVDVPNALQIALSRTQRIGFDTTRQK